VASTKPYIRGRTLQHIDVDNLDVVEWFVVMVHPYGLDRMYDVKTAEDAAENCVFAVQPRGSRCGYEEL